ncbi:MAG: serine protease, partial [Prochlorococcus sp.]|nr:serine protease [Prochlorococcus sp.]
QQCDLIKAVDGQTVKDPAEVQIAVDRGQVGAAMPILLERNGNEFEVSVKPAELPRQR